MQIFPQCPHSWSLVCIMLFMCLRLLCFTLCVGRPSVLSHLLSLFPALFLPPLCLSLMFPPPPLAPVSPMSLCLYLPASLSVFLCLSVWLSLSSVSFSVSVSVLSSFSTLSPLALLFSPSMCVVCLVCVCLRVWLCALCSVVCCVWCVFCCVCICVRMSACSCIRLCACACACVSVYMCWCVRWLFVRVVCGVVCCLVVPFVRGVCMSGFVGVRAIVCCRSCLFVPVFLSCWFPGVLFRISAPAPSPIYLSRKSTLPEAG
mmetsp:Transcript_3703/g.7076  ORF Transcript_3703/g.7076 Transcript_3703/m.7076 type:complete len:260 (+) Transcript_3703:41-820(+)